MTYVRRAIFLLPSVTKQEKKAVDKHTRTEASAFSAFAIIIIPIVDFEIKNDTSKQAL